MSLEDGPFVVSLMQVDEPVPATHVKSTPLSTPSRVSVPEEAVQELGKELEVYIQSSLSNDRILCHVWISVHDALKRDQTLRTRLANQDEFKENVKKSGEDQFIDLLKDIAKRRSWRELLENSTSFPASHHKHPNDGPSPDVFLMQQKSTWNLASASMNGVR
jgi:hypothetical protein